MSDDARLTIGKVVKQLQPNYPDLSISKVRYLEDEGLISPRRTPSGYRMYSKADVRRLERILDLQKNRFLPLSVIKQLLDRDADEGEGEGGLLAAEAEPADDIGLEPEIVGDPDVEGKLHPITNMPDMLGVSISFVRELSEAGIIELKRSPHGRDLVDGKDLSIIRTCDKLRRFGISPRNLRQYVTAANRESGMFEQALTVYGGRGEMTQEERERFEEALSQMLSLTSSLRVQLIRRIVLQHYVPRMQGGDEGRR